MLVVYYIACILSYLQKKKNVSSAASEVKGNAVVFGMSNKEREFGAGLRKAKTQWCGRFSQKHSRTEVSSVM